MMRADAGSLVVASKDHRTHFETCVVPVLIPNPETLQAVGAKLAASLLAPSEFTFAADLVGTN